MHSRLVAGGIRTLCGVRHGVAADARIVQRHKDKFAKDEFAKGMG